MIDTQQISRDVLTEKYCKNGETTVDDVYRRVAKGVAKAEVPEKQQEWEDTFFKNMQDGAIGAGRIMSAAGSDIQATLINCFVEPIGDSIKDIDTEGKPGIYTALLESAETMKRGGGVGYNFSHIRPKNAFVKSVGSFSSGPCSYIDIYDTSCATIESAGCFHGDTLISTTEGLIKISEIVNSPDEVEWYVNTHLGPRKVTTKFKNGEREVWRVITDRGYSTRVTMEHKFAVMDDNNDIQLKTLFDISNRREYENICLLAVDNDVELLTGHPEKEAYIQGALLATGKWVGDDVEEDIRGIIFNETMFSSNLLELIHDYANELGYEPIIRVEPGLGTMVLSLNNSIIMQSWYDLGIRLSDKRIPNHVLHNTTSVQAAFIAGLFDMSAYVDKKNNIYFSSYDYNFIKDIQVLLLHLGIQTLCDIDKDEKDRTIYKLLVKGKNARNKYANTVGIYSVVTIGDGSDISDTNNIILDKVSAVIKEGSYETYDLEVDETHMLSGDGFYTSNSRRGAQMGILDINHPDILEFIKAKRTQGRWNNFNVSVMVTDDFMFAKNENKPFQLVHEAKPSEMLINKGAFQREDGMWVYETIDANVLWDTIMQSNYDYAEPGILFRDTINNDNNLRYIERIDATNPCVTIDTWVMTTDGPRQVRDLIDKPYNAVVDGVSYPSKTGFFFTGKKQIFKVKTTDGYSLKLTDNHLLFKLAGKFEGKNVFSETAVSDLKPIDLIRLNDHKKSLNWDGYGSVNDGFLLGSFILGMDIGLKSNTNKICAILEDLQHIDPNSSNTPTKIEKTSRCFHIGFLNAVFDSFSTVSIVNNELTIKLKHKDYDLLATVQRMLLRLGIVCTRRNTDITIVNSNIIRFYTEVGFTDESKDAVINNFIKQNKDTIKKETFVSAIESIIQQSTEELVYDTTVEDIHVFDANGFHAHNCAEEPLPPYGCCDLGPINLTKFVRNPFTPEAHFDYEKFKLAVSIQVRFLDNVLEVTLWPLEQQRKEAMDKRRIGIGYTGLGNVLAMLGLHYDSEAGRLTAKSIAKCMRDSAYRASVELAKERGPFPLFDKDKYLTDTFASRLPENIKDDIRKYGIRNSHLLSVAPTGCCVPSTMIITSKGLQTIGSLQNNTNDVWQDIDISVKTDSGFKHSDKFYINGERPVITVEDSYGFTITATDNHQLRIINSKGEYVWRRMDEMTEGDVIVKCLDGYPTDIRDKISVDANITSKTTKPTFIKKGLTYSKEMAEFVGFLMSNGNIKTDLHIRLFHHVMYADKTLVYFKDVLKNTFDLDQVSISTSIRKNNENLRELSIYSGDLINWLKQNDAYKTGSRGLRIPNWVLTGSREVIYGFLRGLYEGDGSASTYSVTYTSVDREFINNLQILLSSIGILTRKDIGRKANDAGAFGISPVYRLSIGNRLDKFRFMTKIGFISHKGEKCEILPEWKNIQRTLFGNASKTINKAFGHIKDKQDIDSFKKLNGITEEIMFSEVRNIYHGRGSMTVDISVPENVTYLANSFVSHNTVSLAFCDNASNGIEPPYSLAYIRKKRENDGTMKSYPVVDYGFRVWLETQEPKEAEQLLEAVCNYRDHILVGEDKKKVLIRDLLPKSIVTALELSVDGHLGILKAVQPYIDSSISKTINTPVDYPFVDFKTIYDKAWEYKLKGVATYRPNDILGSVLSVPVETKKEEVKLVTDNIKEDKMEEAIDRADPKDLDPFTVAYPRRPLGDFPSISRKIVYTGATGDVSLFLIVSFINTFGFMNSKTLMIDRPLEIFIVVPPDDVPVEWVTAYAKNLSLIARSSLPLLVKALQDGRSIKSDKGQIRYGWFDKDDGTRAPRFHSSEVGVISYAIQELLHSKGLLDEEGNLLPINDSYIVQTIEKEETDIPTTEQPKQTEPKQTNGNSVIRTNKVCKYCGAAAVIKRDGCSYCTNCNTPGECG